MDTVQYVGIYNIIKIVVTIIVLFCIIINNVASLLTESINNYHVCRYGSRVRWPKLQTWPGHSVMFVNYNKN